MSGREVDQREDDSLCDGDVSPPQKASQAIRQ